MIRHFKVYKTVLLTLAILFSFNEINAQCEILLEDGVTMPVCYQDMVNLRVELPNTYRFVWMHNLDTIADGQFNNVNVEVTENNSLYKLDVYNLNGSPYCTGSEKNITMRPKFNIDFEQLKLTCSNKNQPNGRKGEVKATASGGDASTFEYQWNSPINPYYLEDKQIAVGLSAYTDYTITVTSEFGCAQTDTVRLKAYPNPNIEILSTPKDTVYRDNPYVTWRFNNNDTVFDGHDTIFEVSNFYWEFEGYESTYTSATPTVSFTEEGAKYANLTVENEQGCDTTFTSSINVLPVKLKIPNIFTPNNDGYNDYFEIGYGDDGRPINDLNTYFLSHRLVIFNRWGRTVYESTNYQNDWDGGKLPDGTYFYVLECKGKTDNYRYQGSVMIWNSGR